MTEKTPNTTRRDALKLSLLPIGAAGLSGTAVAEGSDNNQQSGVGPAAEKRLVKLSDPPLTVLDDATDGADLTPAATRDAVFEAQQSVRSTLSSMQSVTVERSFWITNCLLVSYDPTTIDPEADMAPLSGVESIQENVSFEPPEPVEARPRRVSTADEHTTYGLEQLNVPAAWENFDTRGDGVDVAVLDTGVDASHPDFSLFDPDNWTEFTLNADSVDDTTPYDFDGHGTHVSGTAIGTDDPADSSVPQYSVAPDATLHHAKVFSTFDGTTSATSAQVLAGIEWAVEEDIDVFNMSLGIPPGESSVFDDLYLEAIRNARELGSLAVTSSGNSGPELTGSPGNILESFSIGATNRDRSVTDFSSGQRVYTENAWGQYAPDDYPSWYIVPDVAAPGDGVLSAVPGGSYGELSGTSMAAPHISGAIALVLAANPDLSPSEAEALLTETAIHPEGPNGQGTRYGDGIPDVYAALTAADDGAVLTGTVTEVDGATLETPPFVEIQSSYGTTTVASPDGEYELHLGAGEHTVTFDRFGSETVTETVTVDANEEATLDVSLPDQLTVELLDEQPPELADEGSFDLDLVVGSLDEYAVELGDNAANIDAADLTILLGETEVELGEPLTFDRFTAPVTLSVSVADGIDDATLELAHTFSGPGEDISVVTGPTSVIEGEPASFQIADATLPDTAGNEIDVNATIENTGDVQGTKPVAYTIASAPFEESLTIPAGDTDTFSITLSGLVGAFGDGAEVPHSISTPDDEVSGTVLIESDEAEEETPFNVVALDAPDAVPAGEPVSVTATIENAGSTDASRLVTYLFAGEEIEPRAIRLSGSESIDATFSVGTDGLAPGTYEHAVQTATDGTQAPIEITEPEGGTLSGYADDSGVVSADGLLSAFSDWQAGEIDSQLLLDVFAAWQSGESVT